MMLSYLARLADPVASKARSYQLLKASDTDVKKATVKVLQQVLVSFCTRRLKGYMCTADAEQSAKIY
jgi:hypothetical protein